MALDITYGNLTQTEANRLGDASVTPVYARIADKAVAHHVPGDTEPWISRLVGDLIVAKGARTVLETGCFTGATSVYIVDALNRLGGGQFLCCEIDPTRQMATAERLRPYLNSGIGVTFHGGDVLEMLERTTWTFDLAFVDDDHTKKHVRFELAMLYPKMNPGGLILLHDVYGSCDLQSVVREFGGCSLDLPRLGPAGGLGMIQVL